MSISRTNRRRKKKRAAAMVRWRRDEQEHDRILERVCDDPGARWLLSIIEKELFRLAIDSLEDGTS